jgi:hypothetical protein
LSSARRVPARRGSFIALATIVAFLECPACHDFDGAEAPVQLADAGAGAGAESGAAADSGRDAFPVSPAPGPCALRVGVLACDDFEDRTSATNVTGTLWSLSAPAVGDVGILFPGPDSASKAFSVTTPRGGNDLPHLEKTFVVAGKSGLRVEARVRLPAVDYARYIEVIVDGAFYSLVIDSGVFVLQAPPASPSVDGYKRSTVPVPAEWVRVVIDIRFAGGAQLLVDGNVAADVAAPLAEPHSQANVRFGPATGPVAADHKVFLYDDIVVE